MRQRDWNPLLILSNRENWCERSEYFCNQMNQKTDIPNVSIQFPRIPGTDKTKQNKTINKKKPKQTTPKEPKHNPHTHTDKEGESKISFEILNKKKGSKLLRDTSGKKGKILDVPSVRYS